MLANPVIPSPQSRPPAADGAFLEKVAAQFTDPALYVETTLVLGSALLLSAVIAYHPSLRRKAATRAAMEQPKTLVLYGLVGALVGHIVTLNEMMALVVFGIGGLMRFRTDMGDTKDTGRVILVAIVGICCGVQSLLTATLATLFGFLLIWYLEQRVVGSVDIQLDRSHASEAAAAYREILEKAGCKIVGEHKSPNPKKPAVSLVFMVPSRLDRTALQRTAEQLPEQVRGTVDWILS